VTIQWLVDSGGTAFVRQRTLALNAARTTEPLGGLSVRVAPNGQWQTTATAAWTDVPDMSANVVTGPGSDLEMTVSAETFVSGARMLVRRWWTTGQPVLKRSSLRLAHSAEPGPLRLCRGT